jgi:hypothetical protein
MMDLRLVVVNCSSCGGIAARVQGFLYSRPHPSSSIFNDLDEAKSRILRRGILVYQIHHVITWQRGLSIS